MKNIEEICLETFRTKIGNDPVLLKRLKFELIEVEVQDMASYFLELQENGKKHKNENNLMIPWLLGICDEFDHTQDSAHKFGDYPDIDNDLHPQMQKYIKEVWAPQRFGPQFVCNIGNYGTYGLKSSFLDSARIHGLSRDEVLNVTKKLKMKDDEGEILDFDSALELYPEFKEYTVKYPEVTEFALKLMSRLKNMGTHAGGLIISSQELAEIVPLSRPNRNVALASSWGEGLHGQDLSPVGLIKIDLLGLRTLVQISDASRMVKSRYSFRGICATQENEEWDWGDTSYLNDPQCLETARKANLRCVFQFGSDGIRALTRSANISSFDDIAALTALYRPGPMDMGMDESYVNRKNKEESYELHPLLEPILGTTYGVMVFQEQVMQVLAAVGDIPLRDCYQVIKLISKKKTAGFAKYQDQFIKVGQEKLGVTKEYMENFFEQIKAFSGYGFNKSHAYAYSYLSARQIYLQTYYPLEFYTSAIRHQADYDKRKLYIIEAIKNGIKVEPLTINLSKETFDIVDDKIYIGFGDIKGIGEDKAKRIVDNAPYKDFSDFLNRFGNDAAVIKAILGLRVFKDESPEDLYKQYLADQIVQKQKKDKAKRQEASLKEIDSGLRGVLPQELHEKIKLTPDWIENTITVLTKYNTENKFDNAIKECLKIFKKLKRMNDNKLKEKPYLELLKEAFDKIKIDQEFLDEIADETSAQINFYGFPWNSKITKSPDYRGDKNFMAYAELDLAENDYANVEVEITKVEQKDTKKGKKYYQLTVMDDVGVTNKVNVWQDDFDKHEKLFVKGNLVTMQLCPPSGGFETYTFKSYGWNERRSKPKKSNEDFRIFKLRDPE